MTTEGTAIREGIEAPDFTLPDQDGRPVRLRGFRGRHVVLYFYPKDDTPGCTKEACAFLDAIRQFEQAGAVVLGVSTDGQESHRKFIGKFHLPFTLLSDEGAVVSKQYGVYTQKNMYGKKYWGIERTTFVIDQQGVIQSVFRKVKVDGHVDMVLARVQPSSPRPA